MKTELRYAHHPDDFKHYDTARIRKEFLIEEIFLPDNICLIYTLYDRFIVGGAMPLIRPLKLETFSELKAENF
ncbi:5-dehydro-4-deoxy-D-glucuronate isomerase, partial [bacterium]